MRWLWLVAVICALSCGGPTMAAYSPVAHATDLPPERLYAAAEGALLDHGNAIASRDRAMLRLETEPRTMAGSDIQKDKYRYAWIVEIAGGKLKIEVTCQRLSGDSADDCGDKRPQKLVSEQDKLLEAILREARGD